MSVSEEELFLNACKQRVPASDIVHFSLGMVAIISCTLVISLVLCSKLYYSFNYRLLIYWLIAHVLMSSVHVVALPVVWYEPRMAPFCQAVAVLDTYALWVLLLISLFITVEIMSMAVCYVELKLMEIPIVLTSLLLPLTFVWVPFITGSYGYQSPYGCWIRDHDMNRNRCESSEAGKAERLAFWYIPLFILFAFICVSFVTVTLTLALRWCKEKVLYSSDERRPLLSTRSNHYTALKEIVTLFGPPMIGLALIIIFEVGVLLNFPKPTPLWMKALFSATPDIVNVVSAVSVGTHLLVHAKRKRMAIGVCGWCWTSSTPIQLVTSCVNETTEYTTAGSVTISHPTEFEVPFESESFH